MNGYQKKKINILIQEVDAKKHEKNMAKEKFGECADQIDLEARNCFPGGVGVGMIKSAAGYNYHGTRNSKINTGLVCNRCPRCNEVEDQQHVVRYSSIDHLKQAHLIDVEKSLFKIK